MSSIYGKRGVFVRICYLLASLVFLPFGLLICRKNKNIVLCYHGITGKENLLFRKQMHWLDWYYRFKNCNIINRKDKKVPVLVTFDDAYSNLIDHAIPVIEEYHIPVCIFAVSGNLGTLPQWTMLGNHPEKDEQIMDEQDLVDLSENEFVTIGSHSHSHANLAQLTMLKLDQELSRSKKILENLLGREVNTLALPYGAHTDQVIQRAIFHGYKTVFTLVEEFSSEGRTGRVGRFLMSPNVWRIEFALTCVGAYLWLGYFRRLIRWIK